MLLNFWIFLFSLCVLFSLVCGFVLCKLNFFFTQSAAQRQVRDHRTESTLMQTLKKSNFKCLDDFFCWSETQTVAIEGEWKTEKSSVWKEGKFNFIQFLSFTSFCRVPLCCLLFSYCFALALSAMLQSTIGSYTIATGKRERVGKLCKSSWLLSYFFFLRTLTHDLDHIFVSSSCSSNTFPSSFTRDDRRHGTNRLTVNHYKSMNLPPSWLYLAISQQFDSLAAFLR